MIPLARRLSSDRQRKGTPLHAAVYGYSWKRDERDRIAFYLIENGANVNAKDDGGETPLHVVAHEWSDKRKVITDYLIVNGADVNAKDHEGNTPLHIATTASGLFFAPDPEVVNHLVENGADVNARNIDGDGHSSVKIELAGKYHAAFHAALWAVDDVLKRFDLPWRPSQPETAVEIRYSTKTRQNIFVGVIRAGQYIYENRLRFRTLREQIVHGITKDDDDMNLEELKQNMIDIIKSTPCE